jgi:beta-glucosidase
VDPHPPKDDEKNTKIMKGKLPRLKSVIFLVSVTLSFFSCKTEQQKSKSTVESRIDSLVKVMTLEEKAGQLTQYTSDYDVTGPTIRATYKEDIKAGRVGSIFNAIGAAYTRKLQEIAVKETRLGIPLIFGYDVIHGHRTIFPIPLGESASWDLEAIERSARIAATEASAEGLHWTFAPMCDIARDPRWGRMAEGAGEDVHLGAKIGVARVKGFQGEGIGKLNSVLACVKHFAAYGAAQSGRDYHTVDLSDRVLRETYLQPYKAAIDAGAATVMTAFNELDGVPATGNKYLLEKILRDEWKFDGFVVTDYTSIMEMLNHGIAEDTLAAAALALEAGVDMDMQSGFFERLPELVKQGKIKESGIDQAVRRVLRMKFELGLFEDPYRYSDEQREKETVMTDEFLASARDISRKSIVLLKNENQVLPISKDVKTIAVIGPLANNKKEMLGNWFGQGDWRKCVSILEGIQSKVGSRTNVVYAKGCGIESDSTQGFQQAVRIAKQADVVILSLGEGGYMTGEAASRASLNLPGVQQQLMEAIKATGKPVIVILSNGRALTIPWMDKNIPAIVETWFLGTQAGNAIADVLFGDYNPSGKLPVTFPRSVGQVPIFYSMKNTGRPMDPKNKYTSKYLDESNDPLYPFGYGLSYTTFSYTDPKVDKSKITIGKNEEIKVSCVVTNSGKVAGEEVVQLYVRDVVGSVTRPVKELKNFQKIMLQPGESKEILFTLTINDLSFYRRDMSFGAEPGKFIVFVGGNSRDTKQTEFILE